MSGGYLGNIYNSAASGSNYMSDEENSEMLLKSQKSESFIDTGVGIGIGAGIFLGIILIIFVVMAIRYFRMSDTSIVELAKANRSHTNRHIIVKDHGRHSHHSRGHHGNKHHGKVRVKLAL